MFFFFFEKYSCLNGVWPQCLDQVSSTDCHYVTERAAVGNQCALFGTAVIVDVTTTFNEPRACLWLSANGVMIVCGGLANGSCGELALGVGPGSSSGEEGNGINVAAVKHHLSTGTEPVCGRHLPPIH